MNYEYAPELGGRIIVKASRFVGLTEVSSNSRWDNLATEGADLIAAELREELVRAGWQNGWPYCAAFCEVVWKQAYAGRPELPEVRAILNPSCLQSFRNAAELGWTSKIPTLGAIGIMKKGDTAKGHAFIVRGVTDTALATIEANTTPDVSTPDAEREGDGVYCKTRKLEYRPSTGLHLVGFILPCVYA